MFVFCFFSGTCSLFNLIKGCGRLKRDLTPAAQCHQCSRPRAWYWQSARTSICRADRNEAPLPSSNRTRHILMSWVKKGAWWIPPKALRGDLLHMRTQKIQIHVQTNPTFSFKKHQKQPETTFTQKCTSTCTHVHACTQTLRLQSSQEC